MALRNQRPGDDELASNANRKHSGRWATETTCKHHGDMELDGMIWMHAIGFFRWMAWINEVTIMCFFTRHHIVFWNGIGLVFSSDWSIRHSLCVEPNHTCYTQWLVYVYCVHEGRFAKMQTICRPCHSQACQCSALIDEGEEVIQCTLKSGFRPDFDDIFNATGFASKCT